MEVNYQVSKLTAQGLPSKKGHLLLCVSPWCPRSVFRESGGPIASAGCSTMAGGSPSKPGFYSKGEGRWFPMGEKQSPGKTDTCVKSHPHPHQWAETLTLLVWALSNFISCCWTKGR